MSTDIRPEISEKNQYWISKHRYYELKHFCFQYEEWKRKLKELSFLPPNSIGTKQSYTGQVSNPTANNAELIERYKRRIDMVERVATETDDILGEYLLVAMTRGISYDKLRASMNIPCGRDTYYQMYRRFLWLLDQARD